MNKSGKRHLVLIASVVAIASLLLTTIVRAGTSSTNGGVGDARCTASKTITQGSKSWDAYVKSNCDLIIGQIGYTSWTVRQYCPATDKYYVRFQAPNGVVSPNTNYFQRATGCTEYVTNCRNGFIRLQNMGQHEFKTILNTWRPIVNHGETFFVTTHPSGLAGE